MRGLGRFVLLALLLVATATGAQPSAPRGPQKYAVIIGIGAYKDAAITPLKYATADAQAIYNFLVDPAGGGYPKQNVTMLLDQQATDQAIRRALGTELSRRTLDSDMVFVYYAGHGAPEANSREPDGHAKFLVPYDADSDDLHTTAINMADLDKIFARVRAQTLVLVLDTCYSGAGASAGRGFSLMPAGQRSTTMTSDFLDRIARGRGRAVLTAADANEVAVEVAELKHGLFTYYLLEALKGRADVERKGYVTLTEAYDYVSEKVSLHARQLRGEQNPRLMSQMVGPVILAGQPRPIARLIPSPVRSGSLVVNVNEAGAEVFLDDQSIGVVQDGALQFNVLEARKYRLTAKKPGFRDVTREIEIVAGQRAMHLVVLTPMVAAAVPSPPPPAPSAPVAAAGPSPGARPSTPAPSPAASAPPAVAPAAPAPSTSTAAPPPASGPPRVAPTAAPAAAPSAGAPPSPSAPARPGDAPRPVIAAIPPATVPAPPTVRGERSAAIIGVGSYENGKIPRLRAADRDARSVYDALLKGGLLRDNVELLTDAATRPTFASIKRALGVFVRKPAKDDTVLMYYSGRGAIEPDAARVDQDGFSKYLVPRDADPEALFVTGFDMEEFHSIFARSPARTIVLLLDTAFGAASTRGFSRQARADTKLTDDFLDRLTRAKGRIVIAAGGANEPAADHPDSGHGLFTHYVVRGLAGDADLDRNGVITVSELFRYVEPAVADHARRLGVRQRPVMKGTADGDVVLVELKKP